MQAIGKLRSTLRAAKFFESEALGAIGMTKNSAYDLMQTAGVTGSVYDVGAATNIKFHTGMVERETKEKLMNQKGVVIWFTGVFSLSLPLSFSTASPLTHPHYPHRQVSVAVARVPSPAHLNTPSLNAAKSPSSSMATTSVTASTPTLASPPPTVKKTSVALAKSPSFLPSLASSPYPPSFPPTLPIVSASVNA